MGKVVQQFLSGQIFYSTAFKIIYEPFEGNESFESRSGWFAYCGIACIDKRSDKRLWKMYLLNDNLSLEQC